MGGLGTRHTEARRCGPMRRVPAGNARDPIRRGRGGVAAHDPLLPALLARVRIQSSRTAQLWRDVAVEPAGAFKPTTLPVGPYSVHAVDTPDVRVDMKPHVDIDIEPGRLAIAGLLRVSPMPWPGLIGKEGVLRNSASIDSDKLDHVVKTYRDYFKIPGISVA